MTMALCRLAPLPLLALLATAGCPGNVPPGGGHTRPDAAAADLPSDAGPPPLDAPRRDRGGDGSADSASPDQRAPDLVTPDQALPDTTTPDLGGDAPPPCAIQADKDTVALYSFESVGAGSTIDNIAGNGKDATLQSGQMTLINGPQGCGKAAQFTGQSYLEIGHEKAFELKEGAVELWVRFDAGGVAGLVSKDASGQNQSGHLTIYRECNGAIVLRQQTTSQSVRHCSKPVPDGAWIHVAVNFGGAGGMELYVDGVRAQESGKLTCGGEITCGTATLSTGIAPNKNPWVVAASATGSDDGKATPVSSELVGAIDSLRISKKRRSFGP